MEIYWQLILRAGCARFVGHDTLPSQRAAGKSRRDVLHRRPTESNVRVLLSGFLPSMPIPRYTRRASLSTVPEVYCSPSTSGTREMPINLLERADVCNLVLPFAFVLCSNCVKT